ncbi:peritrophin-48-like [Rhagoletis pomonella]|uniref:peritrophin-48-like n=1 Tax=Rhagoletis pomonella TaxID=28610 RepID=UPI001782C801|nr:peritrophin-48-like [Rhagoletis pomonella]
MIFVTVNCTFNSTEICSLLSNGTRIKDPSACNKWITCIDGKPLNGSCADNLFYNRNTYSCVAADSIKCISSNPCAALNGVSGFAADPYACNGYYYCNANGVGTRGECDTGYNFNPGTTDCIKGYPCTLQMNPDSYCNILPDGVFIKDPLNCVGYQLCWKGQVLNGTCPDGFYYDASAGDCGYASNVECAESMSTTTLPPATEYCNETGIFVSDRRSCNGYYYCRASLDSVSGIELQYGTCPMGKFFDEANGGECVPRTGIVCKFNRCVGLASDKIELVNETNDGCHGYTLCQDGVAIGNGTCPDNHYFDELSQLCTSEVIDFPACASTS